MTFKGTSTSGAGTWAVRRLWQMQTTLIGELSEGQQSRLVFAMTCMGKPNLLLLDEPTNHLDLSASTPGAGHQAVQRRCRKPVSRFQAYRPGGGADLGVEDRPCGCGTRTSAYKKHLTRRRSATAKKI